MLEERNRSLLRDIQSLLRHVEDAEPPDELRQFRERIGEVCREYEARTALNLDVLALQRDDVLPNVLSTTSQITNVTRLLAEWFAPPILRAATSDRLCLRIIAWLHGNHADTKGFPPAFSDRFVAIYPILDLGAPLYFFPAIEQRGLLYQPLLFHEFGHLLYVCHKRELDDLVTDLKQAVHDFLLPALRRNDSYARRQAADRQTIVNVWYFWAQELFCDAVGWVIGGPSFLLAFSNFLNRLTTADFFRSRAKLGDSRHPVTWLRIQFLARRAMRDGFDRLARQVIDDWRALATMLNVQEDYHGFYDDALEPRIEQILGDMLIEVSPRPHAPEEAAGGAWSPKVDSPIRLLNWAWQVHASQPSAYPSWEAKQIAHLLS
jgi:hypothetical protein